MELKHTVTFYHLFFALLLFGSIATMVLFVSPAHIGLIVLLIGLVSFTAFYIAALVTSNKKTRILVAVFFAAFLGINAAIGFNILNTALLVCFIIGLKLLLR